MMLFDLYAALSACLQKHTRSFEVLILSNKERDEEIIQKLYKTFSVDLMKSYENLNIKMSDKMTAFFCIKFDVNRALLPKIPEERIW